MPLTSKQISALLEIPSGLSEEEFSYLHSLATGIRSGCIVEVGSFRGRSTAAFAMGSRAGFRVPVYAIDPQEKFTGVYGGKCGPEDRGALFSMLLKLKLYPIVRLINLSSEYLSQEWPLPVRLLFVDGDHRYDAVRRDVECWLPKLHPDASIVFDDALDPDVGPIRVIEELSADPVWKTQATVGKMVSLVSGGGCCA